VAVQNQAAVSFYKKHGFQIMATRKNFYSDGQAAYTMQKIHTGSAY
jgi:ribosomal protein S18 acetylase RimI-like enzyme